MYQFKNTNGKCEIFLYSSIGGDFFDTGITARDVIAQIKEAGDNVSIIDVRINSEGGDVFEAHAMYNYLKSHKARVKVFIDGLAASAASIVACAGEITMPKNSMIMIHNPIGNVYGESGDMREMAAVLDKIRDNIASVYANKTGKDLTEIISMMEKETWLNGEEALAFGFADKVIEAKNYAKNIPERNFEAEISTAIQNERTRLRELDELKAPDCEKEIYAAKYETFKNARDVAYDLLTSGKFLTRETPHEKKSELENISVDNPKIDGEKEIISRIAAGLNKKRGE